MPHILSVSDASPKKGFGIVYSEVTEAKLTRVKPGAVPRNYSHFIYLLSLLRVWKNTHIYISMYYVTLSFPRAYTL